MKWKGRPHLKSKSSSCSRGHGAENPDDQEKAGHGQEGALRAADHRSFLRTWAPTGSEGIRGYIKMTKFSSFINDRGSWEL